MDSLLHMCEIKVILEDMNLNGLPNNVRRNIFAASSRCKQSKVFEDFKNLTVSMDFEEVICNDGYTNVCGVGNPMLMSRLMTLTENLANKMSGSYIRLKMCYKSFDVAKEEILMPYFLSRCFAASNVKKILEHKMCTKVHAAFIVQGAIERCDIKTLDLALVHIRMIIYPWEDFTDDLGQKDLSDKLSSALSYCNTKDLLCKVNCEVIACFERIFPEITFYQLLYSIDRGIRCNHFVNARMMNVRDDWLIKQFTNSECKPNQLNIDTYPISVFISDNASIFIYLWQRGLLPHLVTMWNFCLKIPTRNMIRVWSLSAELMISKFDCVPFKLDREELFVMQSIIFMNEKVSNDNFLLKMDYSTCSMVEMVVALNREDVTLKQLEQVLFTPSAWKFLLVLSTTVSKEFEILSSSCDLSNYSLSKFRCSKGYSTTWGTDSFSLRKDSDGVTFYEIVCVCSIMNKMITYEVKVSV